MFSIIQLKPEQVTQKAADELGECLADMYGGPLFNPLTVEGVKLAAEHGAVFVAHNDVGKIVGTATYVDHWRLAKGGGRVEDMDVLPAYRRQGIGRALLNAIKAFAEERGVKQVNLDTDDFREAAIALYEGEGYKKTGMIPMRLGI
jgi:GNAT superfamily N-acetyltransferase